jgi:hypothetical protein
MKIFLVTEKNLKKNEKFFGDRKKIKKKSKKNKIFLVCRY